MADNPLVTVIIPCRNEEAEIGHCLDSILRQDEPEGGFEIIVADGMSTDRTREIINTRFLADKRVRLIENPEKTTPFGLNRAIKVSSGKIIIRIDVHTEYASDYIVRCVETLLSTGADNVGGPVATKGGGYIRTAVRAAYHSPFAVGGALAHNVNYEGEIDTVAYGCWRKELFDKVGLFDEQLTRNQDDELNLRIIRSGGIIWQNPKIRSWYKPRASLWSLFNQYRQYGYFKVLVIRKHKIPAKLRHLVPMLFLIYLELTAIMGVVGTGLATAGGSKMAGLIGTAGLYSFATGLLIYLCAVTIASMSTAVKWGIRYLPILPIVFICYHFGYGIGFLEGMGRFLILNRQADSSKTLLTR